MNKIASAKIKYIRISQRKMLGICKLVRGQDISVARVILIRTGKKGAKIISKTLNSAVANAKNKNMNSKRLFISKITADMGPSFRRSVPGGKGNAAPIKKKTVHLTIELQERVGDKKVGKAEVKEAKKEETEIVTEKPKETAKDSPVKGKIKTVVKKKESK